MRTCLEILDSHLAILISHENFGIQTPHGDVSLKRNERNSIFDSYKSHCHPSKCIWEKYIALLNIPVYKVFHVTFKTLKAHNWYLWCIKIHVYLGQCFEGHLKGHLLSLKQPATDRLWAVPMMQSQRPPERPSWSPTCFWPQLQSIMGHAKPSKPKSQGRSQAHIVPYV